MQRELIRVTFRQCGTVAEPENVPTRDGVYFFFSSAWRRVMYFGTGEPLAGQRSRTGRVFAYGRPKGKDAFRLGAKTMFAPVEGDDVYALMRRPPDDCRSLVESRQLFVPDWPTKNRHDHERRRDEFRAHLQRSLAPDARNSDSAVVAYLRQLQLWCAPVDGPRQKRSSTRHELESQLQLAFQRRFSISYYTRKWNANQTWLGRVEVRQNHRYQFKCGFDSAPPDFRDDELTIFENPLGGSETIRV